ncbi:MAG: cupin domain-containing protein [Anaerolineae bacterium]
MATENATPTCRLVQAGAPFEGKQGLTYAVGISAESVGATGINMQFVTIPPKARAKAHLHEAHETAIYMVQGEVVMWYGEGLREEMVARAGDFICIPANTPHLPSNPSATETAVALIARTDPNDQESVVLLSALDATR